MTDGNQNDQRDLAAGEFSSWLADIQSALRGERGSEVPCGGCTACCRSSQFVHIGPDETETLAHIPAGLLWPAPRWPAGHVVLGYDERGHCPMLVDDQCSIYPHRPRTCRTYDCRVFPAAGLEADGDQLPVARQARRWQFRVPDEAAATEHQAVRAAASYLIEHPDVLGATPANRAQVAVLAIEIHHAFLGQDETGLTIVVDPDPAVVRAEVRRTRT